MYPHVSLLCTTAISICPSGVGEGMGVGPSGVGVAEGNAVGEGVAVRITRTVGTDPVVGVRDEKALAVALASTARCEALDIQTAMATTRNPTAMAAQAVHAGVLGCSDVDLFSLGMVGFFCSDRPIIARAGGTGNLEAEGMRMI